MFRDSSTFEPCSIPYFCSYLVPHRNAATGVVHNADMDDRALREARTIAAVMVWGSHLEQAGNETARKLTQGLNWRDLLLLSIVHDRSGAELTSHLVGPVFTTTPGVGRSLARLEKAGMVTRGVGDDLRTRPVALTDAAHELAAAIVGPWEPSSRAA